MPRCLGRIGGKNGTANANLTIRDCSVHRVDPNAQHIRGAAAHVEAAADQGIRNHDDKFVRHINRVGKECHLCAVQPQAAGTVVGQADVDMPRFYLRCSDSGNVEGERANRQLARSSDRHGAGGQGQGQSIRISVFRS